MAFCATLFQGVAVWAGLPATLFALLLLGYRLNTRFTWTLLLLGLAGLAAQGLSIACAGWASASVWLPDCCGLAALAHGFSPQAIWRLNLIWLLLGLAVIAACAAAIWRLGACRT
ncbi:MAG: hypothetical protein RBR52_11735 [Thiomonas sp.]|uniref:hypothetical protein n=1 Tax=Thiomonas sp. TaxID=2047785 RepID=UPI002A36C251|nr:hypothetical protein [Thiomonas sp.]MDY0331149.1 hypothetical protein [Thiomonas sp.]